MAKDGTNGKTNKLNVAVGLNFNINTVSRDMNKWFKLQEGDAPIFKKSQVAMTSALQGLTKYIINETLNITPEDLSGCRKIRRGSLILMVASNNEMKEYYGLRITSDFKKVERYDLKVPIIMKEMKQYVNSLNAKIHISEKSYNLLYYMLSVFYIDVLAISNLIMKVGTAKSFSSNTVLAATKIIWRNGVIVSKQLVKDITTAIDLAIDDKAEDKEADGEEEGDDGEEEKVVVADTSKGTKKTVSETNKKASDTKPKAVTNAKKPVKKVVDNDDVIDAAASKAKVVKKVMKKASKKEDDDDDELVDDDIIDAPVKKAAPVKKTGKK